MLTDGILKKFNNSLVVKQNIKDVLFLRLGLYFFLVAIFVVVSTAPLHSRYTIKYQPDPASVFSVPGLSRVSEKHSGDCAHVFVLN